MTREEAIRLLDLCAEADDQDTGSLDAFREAATPGVVYELAFAWLAQSTAALAPFVGEATQPDG